MRLQRLEIVGFKSFPDRSELAFDRGVTAIVGPNGCGKSNVVDAITWVLGEQSAKSLRGDRMEDVIFGGSDGRKPTAAAEVRLRLCGVASRVPGNGKVRPSGPVVAARGTVLVGSGEVVTAGDAVAVLDEPPLIVRDIELSRRLYRSGESEYLIDGEVCRLRDVQDLLMDAGLGVKAYAVIEQGKIGQILSARPTDRRQLIEEAAGVTKYKSRRRSAELKLEAAQQNLTRVDDIIFEVEKQRGALKRQAAKARRYKRLRDQLRQWEKVQFAQRYRRLGEAIEAARGRLADARTREAVAAAHVAEVEARLEALRLELTEADARTTAARETAHARELSIGRLQQQVAFDKQQVEGLTVAAGALESELASLEVRRDPARQELDDRRAAAARATDERQQAADALMAQEESYSAAHRTIEGLEGDVEAARSEAYAAVNAATALRHAMEHAAAARTRIGEHLSKLDIERADLATEARRAEEERITAEDALRRARAALETLHVDRVARESELGVARGRRDALGRELRSREHDLAGTVARLKSLEEIDAARAEYGEGARVVLAESGEDVSQLGSVADHVDVDERYQLAVAACLGDLLQHVVVETHEQARAGLALARERNAGRVGFVIAASGDGEQPIDHDRTSQVHELVPGVVALSSIVQTEGPAADVIRRMCAGAFVADTRENAYAASRLTHAPVATIDGEVFRGTQRVEGGIRSETRTILATKREIKQLREHAELEMASLTRMRDDVASLDVDIAVVESTIASLQAELHRQEKAIVAFELQLGSAGESAERVRRKQEQIATERRTADEELGTQEARRQEAQESIQRIELEQRAADEQLSASQRRLFEARETAESQARRTAEAKAAHAALVERTSGLLIEIQRLEEAARELEERAVARAEDLKRNSARREELRAIIEASERQLSQDLHTFDDLREAVRVADEASQTLRAAFDTHEQTIREDRRSLDGVRGEAAQLDVERATAESDLSHLATTCMENVQATLDEVAVEVEQMEKDGLLASPRPVDDAPDAAEVEDETGAPAAEATLASPAARSLTPDEMVSDLRTKIERMGAVNMMAIDQFDDLESRHTFLTAQRRDLVDSIAATNEAIRRIDKTTRERFQEAFTVINQYFEHTFTTLFGGGRAGLVLLDESDALESGIDIIAQPPGKRLQSIQSGRGCGSPSRSGGPPRLRPGARGARPARRAGARPRRARG